MAKWRQKIARDDEAVGAAHVDAGDWKNALMAMTALGH